MASSGDIENDFDFSIALTILKQGGKVRRRGWSRNALCVFMVPGSNIAVEEGRPLASVLPVGERVTYGAHIDILTGDRTVRPWLASQADLLEADWYVVHPAVVKVTRPPYVYDPGT